MHQPLSDEAEIGLADVLDTPASVLGDDRPRTRSSRPAPLFVCLSHLRWDFVWQRPQHLLTRAAASYRVVMVEEPVRRPVAAAHLDVTTRPGGIRVAVPVLPDGTEGLAAAEMQRRLLRSFLKDEGGDPAVLWYYTPMAMNFTADIAAGVVVYDNMDELSAFRGASAEMLANEEALFRRADLVFTGGMSLYEAKRGRHPNIRALPSSIDARHFGAARTWSRGEPADQAAIGRPRLGFFGVIDERMDLDLVRDLAQLRPDCHFVMIGPVVKIDPASLPRAENLHWLGPKSYSELPAYLAGWDVGLMPFALNEATRFISPTKTPEYLAAGVPVVSTPITDVVHPYGERGLVEIGRGAEEIATLAAAAMARPREPWIAAVDEHLAAGSWDQTWEVIRRSIDRAARGRPARQALSA